MKKALKYLSYFLLSLVLALVLIPFVFEDDLKEFVKNEVNGTINGNLDFSDLNLSFIRSFPKAQIDLENLIIHSDFDRPGDTLAKIGTFSMNVDVLDILNNNENINIHAFTISDADLSIYIPLEGTSNYQLISSDTSSQGQQALSYSVNLDKYAFNNVNLKLINEPSQLYTDVKHLNHTGKGNFNQDEFILNTDTKIQSIDLVSNNTNYVDGLSFDMRSDIAIDQKNGTYEIDEGTFRLGQLKLIGDAKMKTLAEGLFIDAIINSEKQSLKNYLQIIPGVFKKNIDQMEASGNSSLSLTTKGILSDKSYPAFDLEIKATNGQVSVKEVNEKLEDLDIQLLASSTKNDLSDFVINIPSLQFKIDEQFVSASLNTSNVLKDPNIKGHLNTDIDLKTINKIIQLDNIQSIAGKLYSDLQFDVKQSDIRSSNYEQMRVSGSIRPENVDIKLNERPSVQIPSGIITFDPYKSDFQFRGIELGQSKMDINGEVINVLSILDTAYQTQVNLNINSPYFDANEWISNESNEPQPLYTVQDQWIVNTNVNINKLAYQTYNIQNLSADMVIRENDIDLTRSDAVINGSAVKADGYLSNTARFVMSADTLLGQLNVRSDNFNATKFMNASEEVNSDKNSILRIPSNIKLLVDARSDKLSYEDYRLSGFKSNIFINQGIASLQNAKAKGFDGDVRFDGFYDSNPELPTFSIAYNVDQLNFIELYKSSNMFSQLAPLAKYVTGNFNSDLQMTGTIDENYNPILNNITADGFIETINSQIIGFPPLQALSNSLGIQALKEFAIKNTKNWLTIEDGRVIVKPTNHKIDGINMLVSGSHSIKQEINYLLKMEIPRTIFKKNDGLVVVDQSLNKLSSEAEKLGIDIFSGDYIYIEAEITGTITSPKVNIKPTGSGGEKMTKQAEDALVKKVDDIKKEYKEKATSRFKDTRDTAKVLIDKEVNKAKKVADSLVQETKDKLTNKAKDIIKEKVDSSLTGMIPDSIQSNMKDKLDDILNSDSKESEKLKKELEKLNPFKKKKKEN